MNTFNPSKVSLNDRYFLFFQPNGLYTIKPYTQLAIYNTPGSKSPSTAVDYYDYLLTDYLSLLSASRMK